MSNLFRILLFVLPVLLHTAAGVRYQEVNYKSYTLLLHSFAKNIDWPNETGRATFVYGVYGHSKIYNELVALSRTKKVRNMTIEVRTINTPAEAASCDILFIPAQRSAAVKDINKAIGTKSVLVVCERSGYCLKGGAISFNVDDDGTLRFDINTAVCTQQKLKVRPQLLQIADRVY
ncbi:MAG: YfiR family protein [Bacteroidia bacterium]